MFTGYCTLHKSNITVQCWLGACKDTPKTPADILFLGTGSKSTSVVLAIGGSDVQPIESS